MAITARTILTQPAATAVAAVTLLGLTVLGTGLYSTTHDPTMFAADPCERPLIEQNERSWGEADWISYVSCFEARRDTAGTVRAASLALEYQPQSEILWNVKAYSQIELGQYRPAVRTLRSALERIEPTTGTMENNLAWAGLYVGMDVEEARDLYVAALEKTPRSCEMIHTGLFVEFERAQTEDRYVRFWALKNYKQLRMAYSNSRCETRTEHGSWQTLAEVAGVGMLDEEVEKLTGKADAKANDTLYTTVERLGEHHHDADMTAFCSEAFPPSHSDIECESYVEDTRAEIVLERRQPHERNAKKRTFDDCLK